MKDPKHSRRSLFFRSIGGMFAGIAGAYLLLVGVVWYSQAKFIFHPARVVAVNPGDLGVAFDKVTLPVAGDRLAGWWVPSKEPRARTLLYLHGNAGNMAANARHVLRLHSTGLNVFIFDYRGYGDSTGGPPREKLVYEDAQRAWQYLVEERRIPAADIAIYGHSLGGAVAVELAGKHPEAGALITESTFTSVADEADGSSLYTLLPIRLILTERFDSASKIASIHLPKLIIHGLADTMIPPRMAQRLYDAAPDPKQLALIPGGHHDDSAVVNGPAYFAALHTFLRRYHFEPATADAGGTAREQ
jgi:fermentation-respiration switch protein FrsA (DUF1100 family)